MDIPGQGSVPATVHAFKMMYGEDVFKPQDYPTALGLESSRKMPR